MLYSLGFYNTYIPDFSLASISAHISSASPSLPDLNIVLFLSDLSKFFFVYLFYPFSMISCMPIALEPTYPEDHEVNMPKK